MTTSKNKSGHNDFDLYEDVERIKSALKIASQDVKGKAAEMLSDSMDEVIEKTTDVRDNVANYASDQPFKSMGIALLVGVAIGYLLRK